ncbi:porin [Algicola sagamiensis]|uniref:porin n=1 Tax=Algicola sagamiensis TaxID=163869 RepID=UPI00036BFD92|nr:porin [Algicola sagamiensis]
MRKLATIAVAVASVCASGYVAAEDKVNWNGAIRFTYSVKDYPKGASEDNENRWGDAGLDVFRIGVSGKNGEIDFSTQYRFYNDYHFIHHGWIGYDIDKNSRVQLGIQLIPFGNTPFNSNNFFESINYYVGLEDEFDTGLLYRYTNDMMRLDLGWFMSSEYGSSSTNERYAPDVIGFRTTTRGVEGPNTAVVASNVLQEDDSLIGRLAFNVAKDWEIGASFQYQRMFNGCAKSDGCLVKNLGEKTAYALHTNATFGAFNVMAQYTQYEYDLEGDMQRLVIGYFDFNDTIPGEAKIGNLNLAYTFNVNMGPFKTLKVYNDLSLMWDKSVNPTDKIEDTFFNATGVTLGAGAVYVVMDYYWAKNMPFIGGTLDSMTDESSGRFYMNVGYYF